MNNEKINVAQVEQMYSQESTCLWGKNLMFLLVVSSYSKKRNGNIVHFHKAKLKSTLFAVKHLRLYNLPIIVLGYIWMPACLPIGKSIIYENMPFEIHVYWKFYRWKMKIFSLKKSDIFHISAQNIDYGYSLELPRRGSSNVYLQSMFLSRNKKNNVYPCKPQCYYIKMGSKGVKII